MENIIKGLNKVYNLPEKAIRLFLQKLEETPLDKGHILFSPARKHHYVHFIESGLVRAFSYHKEKEVTFWFGTEGDVVFPYRTYLKGEISYEIVETLENCSIYRIAQNELKELFINDIEWANWGRKLAEKQMVLLEERFIDYQFQSGANRYEKLIAIHPKLFNRVKLQHLASYLRMSQVSLSRIRAGKQ